MIIPIRDLYGLKGQKAFRFGHSGLIVVIKGHEELFFEFSSAKRRKACVALLEQRMEAVRLQEEDGASTPHDPDMQKIEARIMEDLDESTAVEPRSTGPPVSPDRLFGSTTSTFLEFKPESMRVTCLTIGSRGDVQPYIALCKGLQAEGHTTRIATHGEYKDWVEGVGPSSVRLTAKLMWVSSMVSSSLALAVIRRNSYKCVSTMACSPYLSSKKGCRRSVRFPILPSRCTSYLTILVPRLAGRSAQLVVESLSGVRLAH